MSFHVSTLLIKSTKQLMILQKNVIKSYRVSIGKWPNRITKILEAKLVYFEMYRTRYHGGNLEGTSIVIFFKILINIQWILEWNWLNPY